MVAPKDWALFASQRTLPVAASMAKKLGFSYRGVGRIRGGTQGCAHVTEGGCPVDRRAVERRATDEPTGGPAEDDSGRPPNGSGGRIERVIGTVLAEYPQEVRGAVRRQAGVGTDLVEVAPGIDPDHVGRPDQASVLGVERKDLLGGRRLGVGVIAVGDSEHDVVEAGQIGSRGPDVPAPVVEDLS